MLIQTSELTDAALDWAVAKCAGKNPSLFISHRTGKLAPEHNYSTDWAQAGPIIEREKITTVWAHFHWCSGTGDIGEIYRTDDGNHFTGIGPTPLIAAMRCYVTSKLGETVDVPDELCTQEASVNQQRPRG